MIAVAGQLLAFVLGLAIVGSGGTRFLLLLQQTRSLASVVPAADRLVLAPILGELCCSISAVIAVSTNPGPRLSYITSSVAFAPATADGCSAEAYVGDRWPVT